MRLSGGGACEPKIVRSRFDADKLSSQEIDRVVTEMYQRGERIYEVDEDVLSDAAPGPGHYAGLVRVCAVSYDEMCGTRRRGWHTRRMSFRWNRTLDQ